MSPGIDRDVLAKLGLDPAHQGSLETLATRGDITTKLVQLTESLLEDELQLSTCSLHGSVQEMN